MRLPGGGWVGPNTLLLGPQVLMQELPSIALTLQHAMGSPATTFKRFLVPGIATYNVLQGCIR